MIVHWIWLAQRSRLGDELRMSVLRHFSDPEAIYYARKQELNRVEGMTQDALDTLLDKDLSPAQKIMEQCARKQIDILTWADEAYPKKLKQICNPPYVLYYQGKLPDFDSVPVIGVVGTRKASAYGLASARRLGYQIAKCGGLVVSGVASGIDAEAMDAALTAAEPVVGVLGCGVDVVFPAANRELYRQVRNYGCLLSEFAPGTRPAKWTFPRRNRIISGLSDGILVVEAPVQSGALITARWACEQNRDVFVVPGNIDVPSCVGSNALLREGAGLVCSGWDILREYTRLYPDKIRHWTGEEEPVAVPQTEQKQAFQEEKPGGLENVHKKVIDKEPAGPYSDVDAMPVSLSETEKQVLAALKSGEELPDNLAVQTGLGANQVMAALTMLQIKGLVRRLPGNRVAAAIGPK